MQDFTFYNPVKYIFGKTAFDHLASEAKIFGHKVLVIYGKGSIKKNGIYEKVMKSLKGFEVKEFSGIEPNPRIETLEGAIDLAREFKPDLLLAIGGGSVIDGVKLISAAINYEGDAWDIVENKPEIDWETVPLAVVLTMSATGSEMNGNSVITKRKEKKKDYFSSIVVFPKFSIVDPTVQYSLPKDQLAYGIIDAYSHVLEQYLNTSLTAPLQDRMAEGVLLTLIENAQKALNDTQDYESRANIVFSATMALNNLIGVGVNQDWLTHDIEHILSAYYDIPHGAGLAILTASVLREKALQDRKEKLAQYGKRVWNLEGDVSSVAKEAINKTHEFFASLGVKMTLTEWGIKKEESFSELVTACNDAAEMGPTPRVTEEELKSILEAVY